MTANEPLAAIRACSEWAGSKDRFRGRSGRSQTLNRPDFTRFWAIQWPEVGKIRASSGSHRRGRAWRVSNR